MKPSIVIQSSDKDDCKDRMHAEVNKQVVDFVKNDNFFHDVPTEDIDTLKKKLDMGFEQAYQDKYNEKKYESYLHFIKCFLKYFYDFTLLFIVFILIFLFKS